MRVIARAQETKSFSEIGEGIKTSITTSKDDFDVTMKSMKSLLSATQATEQNTQPEAYMRIAGFVALADSLPVAVDHQVHFNFVLENIGNADANTLVEDSKIYLGKPDDSKDQNRLRLAFENWWKHPAREHWKTKNYAAKDKAAFFTSPAPSLTTEDLRQMQGGLLTFYIFERVIYSDVYGRWQYDACYWLQKPLQDLVISHACEVNTNPRHKIKQLS